MWNNGSQSSESQSEHNSSSESEHLSESNNGELKKINASVRIDYGNIKVNKAVPILDKEVDFDVSSEIATSAYGDEVVISYYEQQEDYDVEVIEKDVLSGVSVVMTMAPGAKYGDYECYSEIDGVVFNIDNIDYIINLDGSFTGKDEWHKYMGISLYATYNPENSIQTTDVSILHYLTAFYSYNPRKVEKDVEENGPSV